MVATVIASAFAKSEAVNVTRRQFIDQTQQMWGNSNIVENLASAPSASSAAQQAQQQASSFISETAQKVYEFLYDLLQGATTNIRRTVFGTAGGGAGAHAICSAENKPGTTTAFTHEQEHFLSGIISILHNEHATALEKAQRRTYLLCGVTATASIAAAIASSYYFFVYRPRQEKLKKQQELLSALAVVEEESDDTQSPKNKILIKKLNFKGDADAFVSLLSRIKNIDSSSSENSNGEASFIQIEEACVTTGNDDAVKQTSTFAIDYYDDISSGAQSRSASDVY